MSNLAESPVSDDYLERINRAIDHIVRHLDRPQRLEEVAGVAAFSPFHFHRIFKSATGETLQQFVNRVRLERAIYLMSHRPDRSLTEIALAVGFAASSDFSRSFKKLYGVPPRVFDLNAWRDSRRAELQRSVNGEMPAPRLLRLRTGKNPDGFKVELRQLPARAVAYIRVLEPFRPGAVPQAAARLVDWAVVRGFSENQWLGYMWEDPEIVPLDKCRYDVGVEVPAEVQPDGEIGVQRFGPMRVAEVALDGDIALEQRCFDWLYRTWLPQSGFAPDHQPAFEAWEGLPFVHGMERFVLRVQLPVVLAHEPL